jgi:hypothetical protein
LQAAHELRLRDLVCAKAGEVGVLDLAVEKLVTPLPQPVY